jgi:hypothetical protein
MRKKDVVQFDLKNQIVRDIWNLSEFYTARQNRTMAGSYRQIIATEYLIQNVNLILREPLGAGDKHEYSR